MAFSVLFTTPCVVPNTPNAQRSLSFNAKSRASGFRSISKRDFLSGAKALALSSRRRFECRADSIQIFCLKIAVAGGTGFVGSRLVRRLVADGDEVIVLTRNVSKAQRSLPRGVTIVPYQPSQSGDWQSAVDGVDAVVNLAGASIAESRWTPERKREILESREETTKKIVEAIGKSKKKTPVLVNTSAIGFYGSSETLSYEEDSAPGKDFLAQVCTKWEAAAQAVTSYGTRLVILRFGIVLGEEGGALAKMIPIFKVFAGGPLGDGRQWFSWVHVDDLVDLIIWSIKNPGVQGVYNATAPNPVRMNTLCTALGNSMSRPSWMPVPKFALELLLGEGAQTVLEGQQVLPKRTLSSGFSFKYPTIDAAMKDIIR
eukprot:CAMPEP_0184340530 /NCGR_PEP_ID=MMETSP1089-20130417/9205_1 /TAXON_ID=38269 ORGANISM="Gloeochaete wittrockiana, Strain SAG46.84" /NCGR_SAMPLE_ID=MMETSP1089 /ASSEMBLY_ACC=CAM_ASM_000445 /LENGTH=371 /DNA_ID=CAMNT_0026668385 /DNA_START=18 /DNA_END=1133 /DNA_ORIENTATION=-